jgi:transposase
MLHLSHLIKIAFSLFLLLVNTLAIAQNNIIAPSTPLPVDPNVKTGQLKNGLTYYIRKNDRPEDRMELRLVINAGSILETEAQLGLAHFMEHMNFNGTENFARNDIVDYLQSIGVKFGADLNAYTSFDETVYILPVPTNEKQMVDQSFQILEDWAHNALLEEEEIDKERGVVLEEWRIGRGANQRMLEQYLPVLLKGSRYAERLPIGKKEVLENFKPETLREFYRDWYRPDLMAVIAVGDLDVEETEKQIKAHFGSIEMPEIVKERPNYDIPDHEETLVAVAKDKEASFTSIRITNKMDAGPRETVGDYRREISYLLYTGMLTQKEAVQQISYQHTKQILGDEIRMVFYDVTTLYFEIEKEDTLRKTGFSKDGKHQNPQIVLGLLVSANAYPLAYDIFEGNKYEGDTMLPIIDSFRQKYSFETLTIVADSGLISERNIQDLEERGYKYILGARIKNQPRSIEEQIHALDLRDGECQIIWKDPGTALVISFSARRARKDYFNRERGLKRLEKQIISGKLTKSSINKRGYNKYLKLEGEMDISIDREKFDADGKWDGLKGYQTNDKSLSGQQVMDSYRQLWKIEKAFRISKHDLKIRPIYHRVQRRIEAHICLSFAAYKVYKELERQLYSKNASISAEKAIDIAKTIFNIKVSLKESKCPPG